MIQDHGNLHVSPRKASREKDCETNASSNGDPADYSPTFRKRLCPKAGPEHMCPDQPFCMEAHSLPELLKQDSIGEACSAFHTELSCGSGLNCRYTHSEASAREIMGKLWRNNRLLMLTNYPELVLARGSCQRSSVLFC